MSGNPRSEKLQLNIESNNWKYLYVCIPRMKEIPNESDLLRQEIKELNTAANHNLSKISQGLTVLQQSNEELDNSIKQKNSEIINLIEEKMNSVEKMKKNYCNTIDSLNRWRFFLGFLLLLSISYQVYVAYA